MALQDSYASVLRFDTVTQTLQYAKGLEWLDVPSASSQSSIALAGSANTLTLSGSSTGNPVSIVATGTDSNVTLQLLSQGIFGPVVEGSTDGLAFVQEFHSGPAFPGSPDSPLDFIIQNRIPDNGWAGETVVSASSDGTWPYIEFLKAGTSLSAPSQTPTGGIVGEVAFIAYNGGYTVSSLIDAKCFGTDSRTGSIGFCIAASNGGFDQDNPDFVFQSVGFLKPRMTTTQKNAIPTPPEGLEVYDTTLHAPCWFDGSTWQTVAHV